MSVNPDVYNLFTGPLFDWVEDSHASGFYLQGVSSEMCKLRNYILYTGTFYRYLIWYPISPECAQA